MKLHKSKILGGMVEGALGPYSNPELLAAQNDALLNQEKIEKEAILQRMIMQRKAMMEDVGAAGLYTDHRKPPVECRFDIENYSIRGMPQPSSNNNYVSLQNQNRMVALLQQQDHIDRQVKNQTVPHVPHTEFEGYKAITKNTINDFPRDINGLKQALLPQQYQTPLR